MELDQPRNIVEPHLNRIPDHWTRVGGVWRYTRLTNERYPTIEHFGPDGRPPVELTDFLDYTVQTTPAEARAAMGVYQLPESTEILPWVQKLYADFEKLG